MWPIIIVFIILYAFVYFIKWKMPAWIGRSGEKFVSRKLFDLDQEKYKVLDDLMLPSNGNTATTQIDHTVVSNYGIFCIETKNYEGWIFGNAYQQYWTQVIYRHKERFYNPMRQNYAHTKAIEALVRPLFPNIPILGFIAFPSAEKLQISGTDSVGHVRDIIEKIKLFNAVVLSDVDRDRVQQILFTANIQDKEMRKNHNRDARSMKNLSGL